MSTSPFLPSSRARRAATRRRRRRRRTLSGALLLIVAVVILVVVMDAGGNAGHTSPRGIGRSTRSRAPATAHPLRSQLGLPLGKAALTLSVARTAVHVAFRNPPRAGMLFDLDDGRIFWARNPYMRLRIASLTKMMTALITVESAPADAPVLVTKQAVEAAGSKVGVLPLGKHVPLESMLYGLLLPSGNDAAIALAQHVDGSVSRFVVQMNEQAARLGLGCTRYSSPSGYFNEHNYSCAADLAVLAHDDLAQPRIAAITKTYSAVLPFPIKGGRLYLYNNNPLLIYGYPGTTGLKTGYTEAAGKCLVATAERDGVRLGVVLLNSPNPATQARQLLDRGFEQVFHQAPVEEPPIPTSE
jgi:serine-type D-Ala-D-Ala carboxypeptidase (penicillin-binding protein 5/6)